TQRSPSRKGRPDPPAIGAVPWKKSANVEDGPPLRFSANVSADTTGAPDPATWPPTPVELTQPVPLAASASFAHGQLAPEPSPKQYGAPATDWHSSGTWSWSRSGLRPAAMSQPSGIVFRLQSGAPAAIAHASPTWSPSQSACVGLAIATQLSHA